MATIDHNEEAKTAKEYFQMRLRNMPKDVRNIILTKQAEKKISCNCLYSMEQTIYSIIRESVGKKSASNI